VRADDGAEYPDTGADLLPPAQHIARLDRLIADQAEELVALHTTVREVIALCDMAEWAAESAADGSPVVVRVDDLRRVLALRPRPAEPDS
jgi:hypothetical protein